MAWDIVEDSGHPLTMIGQKAPIVGYGTVFEATILLRLREDGRSNYTHREPKSHPP
ncbi:hypothetical protein BH18ACT10_BH18ACT10_11620 [soil metagenome]|nr:hypothetical protein [Rubrobacter sp.]